MPVLRLMLGRFMLTTEQIGRAMMIAASEGAPKQILEIPDIRELANRWPG